MELVELNPKPTTMVDWDWRQGFPPGSSDASLLEVRVGFVCTGDEGPDCDENGREKQPTHEVESIKHKHNKDLSGSQKSGLPHLRALTG